MTAAGILAAVGLIVLAVLIAVVFVWLNDALNLPTRGYRLPRRRRGRRR
mgnify:CR=1 FL=1